MDSALLDLVLASTGASSAKRGDQIQSLWSGYGEIVRIHLEGSPHGGSVIVKHVAPPHGGSHPRGWSTDRSHERKLRSYEVEGTFYQRFASRCLPQARVPRCFAIAERDGQHFFVLEDLDAAGFPARGASLRESQLDACLRWLGHFHAAFIGVPAEGLWETGTYWHLATRPDEWAAMADSDLRKHAKNIDERLSSARFQTFVHGDAKVANFCFSTDGSTVAAVDFQYVGGGCGMKDLAYFLGSCLSEDECEEREVELLDRYFDHLKAGLGDKLADETWQALEAEWRALFPVAWADFHRFLQGWAPGHWKVNGYGDRLVAEVISELQSTS